MRLLVLCLNKKEELALLIPVLQILLRQNTNLSINVLCYKGYASFFQNIPGLHIIGVDISKDYYGLQGTFRLYRELKKLGPYTKGFDFQAGWVSYAIQFYFLFHNLWFYTFNKNKRNIKALLRRRWKHFHNLQHITHRYIALFEKVGLSTCKINEIKKESWISLNTSARAVASKYIKKESFDKDKIWVGLAPFSKFSQKIWPIQKLEELILKVTQEFSVHFFIFSSVMDIKTRLRETSQNISYVEKYNLEEEMAIMSRMNLFLSMDTLYMQLSALLKVPVISIWGPTHPYAGFSPITQEKNTMIQIPHSALPCRPCSLRGEKKCFRKNLDCMEWISVAEVFAKMKDVLSIL